MTKSLLEQLMDAVERDLPDWKWLIRADKERGYFANVTRDETSKPLPGNPTALVHVPFMKCPHYAPTREAALTAAYLEAMGRQRDLNEAMLMTDVVLDQITGFFGGVFEPPACDPFPHQVHEAIMPPSARLHRLAPPRG